MPLPTEEYLQQIEMSIQGLIRARDMARMVMWDQANGASLSDITIDSMMGEVFGSAVAGLQPVATAEAVLAATGIVVILPVPPAQPVIPG